MSGVEGFSHKVEADTCDLIDDDIVAFFDLLARFDFEDGQKEISGLSTDSPPTPESQC